MQVVSPVSMETPTKSSGNTDKGLMKKLKGFDGLVMSIGNSNIENAEDGAEQGPQRSVILYNFPFLAIYLVLKSIVVFTVSVLFILPSKHSLALFGSL